MSSRLLALVLAVLAALSVAAGAFAAVRLSDAPHRVVAVVAIDGPSGTCVTCT